MFGDKNEILYAEQVEVQISKGITPESASADLIVSILKPIHAKWLTQYYNHISTNEDIMKNG